MKNRLLLIFIVFSFGANSCFGADRKLSLKAQFVWYLKGSWKMTIKEYGKTGGARFNYSASYRAKKKPEDQYPSRMVNEKKTTLSKGRINLLEKTLSEQEFFTSPKYLRSHKHAFHKPEYRLKVCFDDKCHYVNMYNPGGIPKYLRGEAEKFTVVWKLLLSFVEGSGFGKSGLIKLVDHQE